jgi:hypothetical protein
MLWCAVKASDEKRHLLRFWVDTDANNRPIAPTFAPRSSVQAQGGFKVRVAVDPAAELLPI